VVEKLTEDATPVPLLWTTRVLLVAATVVWLYRAFAKERVFLELAAAPRTARLPDTPALARASVAAGDGIEVTFAPEGRRFVAQPGNTLLEVAEANGMAIESGCRMGMCGADPVAIEDGAECLSEMTSDERTTLERLGLAQGTRLACCARVSGPVTLAVEARPEEPAAANGAPRCQYDRSVERVVVLGNGVTGITAADHIRRRHPDCSIDVVADEIHHFYNRMAISRLIYARSAMQGLFLLPETWYDEKRITTWLNTRAVAIERETRVVRLGTEEDLPYDRLVLAMGSSSAVPPIGGFGLGGSFVLRKAEDALELRAFVQEHGCRRAVVGGGGLLGLEAAYALHKLGLRVTVLERSKRLLRRQLDARASALLRAYLEGLGIRIALQGEVTGVYGNGRVSEVTLTDGQTLASDVFLVCAGIRPNLALAHQAGLATDRGVIVDDHMRTTDPVIYAAGDVAQHRDQVSGIWPVAVEQAKVAAENITGEDETCSRLVPITTLKVAGIDLTSIGQFEARDPHEEEIVHEDAAAQRYRKLVLREGRARGAILLGAPGDAPAVSEAVKHEADISAVVGELRGGDWSVMVGLPHRAPSQSTIAARCTPGGPEPREVG
jgi:NADPH-dependent 2,4-dienoyl-CoA reductase/sulfur reductase-like enzyme/ferredoxin